MADQPNVSPPVTQLTDIPLSLEASAHAPFIYFEVASAYGFFNGVVRITLEAARVSPSGEGLVKTDRVTVAHLRMSIPAAAALKAAIDGALLLASPPASGAKN
ncbi:MAG: hypothetical protein JO278_05215 [Dyella sp.]|nr:hypothetical protein [Dyella sp.]